MANSCPLKMAGFQAPISGWFWAPHDNLPLEAVQEAIAYCESNPPELAEDYAREEAVMEATGMNDPAYDGRPKVLAPQDMSRLRRL
jgi:hypothetical protein